MAKVSLVGVPLRLREEYLEHDQDLLRELALVRLGAERSDPCSVPDRLLSIADELRSLYGVFTTGPDAELEAAALRGEHECDVTYTVPVHAAEFVVRLGAVLDEAEQYCSEGRVLLTLEATPEVLAYRRWVLGEFARQIAGRPPTPWSAAREAEGAAGPPQAASSRSEVGSR